MNTPTTTTKPQNHVRDPLLELVLPSPTVPPSSPSGSSHNDDRDEELWPSTPPSPPLVEGDIRQVNIGWLKPHPFSIKIYGAEVADKGLVESIKAVGIQTPLQVTVDGVVISGHRRLEAAKQTHLKTVPVFVIPSRHLPGAVEEQILEANRARVKDNEQKLREFIAFKGIETARAKERNGYRWDLVPNSAPGDAEPKPGVDPRPHATLVQEAGKARNLAARKVGMGGSTAADGEKVVAALDRLWVAEEYWDHGQLREALLKSIHGALQLGLERGWIPKSAKKPAGKYQPLISDNPGEDTDEKPTSAPESTCEPAVDQATLDPVAETVDPAGSTETASSHDPVAQPLPSDAGLYRDKPMPDEEKHGEQVPGSVVVASSAAGTFVTPLTTILPSEDPVQTPLPDSVGVAVESGEPVGDLIPADRSAQILAAVTRRDFPGSTDPDILECCRDCVELTSALLNRQAKKYPEMSGSNLCRALGMANTKTQVVMKWM